MIQAHIFYSGTVQGVGFRYTFLRYATLLQLNGWVRNLSDGRVEVVVEGSRETVEELMKRIDDRFKGYVGDKEVTFESADNTSQGFSIIS